MCRDKLFLVFGEIPPLHSTSSLHIGFSQLRLRQKRPTLIAHDLDFIAPDAIHGRTTDHDSEISCAGTALVPAVVEVYLRN